MSTLQIPLLVDVPEAPPRRRLKALSPPVRVAAFALGLALASLPGALAHGAVTGAAALHGLAAWSQPYFLPQHAGLLYGAVPLVVLSAYVLLLAPGLLLALSAGVAARLEAWLLAALAISLVLVSVVAGAVQAILGSPLEGGAFVLVVAGLGVAAAAVAVLRARRQPPAWPARRALPGLAPLVLLPCALLAALAPKLLWEAFNAEAAHAFESARLLLYQPLPFWRSGASALASYPDAASLAFAYPVSWLIRLFGPVEAAARLTFPLFLAAAYAGTIELARAGRAREPGQLARWLVWAGLVPYTLAMAYSASTSPYSADITRPGAPATLLVAFFLAAAAAFVDGRLGWFAAFAALALVTLPGGALLLGLFLLATLLVGRPRPARRLATAGGIVAALYGATLLLPPLLRLVGLPAPAGGDPVLPIGRAFAYLQWSDWRRVLFVVVPCGIVPALALPAWSRQDGPARAVTAVIAAWFVLFYAQGLTGLDHFAPIMVLPLAVFWRMASSEQGNVRRGLAALAAAGALAATILSLPRISLPYVESRAVGETVVDRMGGYEQGDPAVFRRASLLGRVFPPYADPRVPAASFGGEPVVFGYYAAHAPEDAAVNYAIESARLPAPAGWRRLAVQGDAALDVLSDAVMTTHLALRPRTQRGASIYFVPRDMIFPSVGGDGRVFSSLGLLSHVGLDPAPLERLLGRPGA